MSLYHANISLACICTVQCPLITPCIPASLLTDCSSYLCLYSLISSDHTLCSSMLTDWLFFLSVSVQFNVLWSHPVFQHAYWLVIVLPICVCTVQFPLVTPSVPASLLTDSPTYLCLYSSMSSDHTLCSRMLTDWLFFLSVCEQFNVLWSHPVLQYPYWLNFVSCTTSPFGLGSVLDLIEHDFIRIWKSEKVNTCLLSTVG